MHYSHMKQNKPKMMVSSDTVDTMMMTEIEGEQQMKEIKDINQVEAPSIMAAKEADVEDDVSYYDDHVPAAHEEDDYHTYEDIIEQHSV